MPLIDPVTMGGASNATQDWMTKLMGKKLGDTSDTGTFATKDLPNKHRVLQPDSMKSMDHDPERLNIHVGADGTVNQVTHG